MNYKRLYNEIIENRKQNPIKGYTEKHHIIPRSLNGTDEKENLVNLTAREHFICHYLLTKMYDKRTNNHYKLVCAFNMMNMSGEYHTRYFNSYLYEANKIQFSKLQSKNQKGQKNSQFGKMWITNGKDNKKIRKDEIIPEGFRKGRVIPKEIKEKIRKSMKGVGVGRVRSDKTKAKISRTLKLRHRSINL
jgi:hypothetical protein